MAYRTLKVVRVVDDAEAVLFETSLNEDETAGVAVVKRVVQTVEQNPGLDEDQELEDVLVVIEPKAKPKAKPEPEAAAKKSSSKA